MLLNGTYLVGNDSIDEFAARVDSLAAEHPDVRVELTGPWPAYSFAGVEEEPVS
jgi:Gas vesicle synthesis protein GvpL/GvpF.